MKIGMMNNPRKDVLSEIKRAKKDFDFIDLTIQFPKAHPLAVDFNKVKKVLGNFPAVGHTDWSLPYTHPNPNIRRAATEELVSNLKSFHKLGIKKMNVHLLPCREEFSKQYSGWLEEMFKILVKEANKRKMVVMIENFTADSHDISMLEYLFKHVPELRFHLDVGHAHIKNGEKGFKIFMKKFSSRLAHVHFSDNHFNDDEHIAIGSGSINWKNVIKSLKKCRYDGTITLEVFSGPKYLLTSKKKLLDYWRKC